MFVIVGAGLTVSVNGTVAVTWLASVTRMVNLAVPLTMGVPLIIPVAGFNENPAGSKPPTRDQLYGTAPPVAFNVCNSLT